MCGQTLETGSSFFDGCGGNRRRSVKSIRATEGMGFLVCIDLVGIHLAGQVQSERIATRSTSMAEV